MSKIKVKRALISVYYKDNIIKLANFLQTKNVEIISTGGTYKILKDNNINCIPIEDFTGLKEFFGGRVKTLHPLIHGGILSKRDSEADNLGIKQIDLVVVNFYPFENLVLSGEKSIDKLIEMIDIGGPTMLRAASKNYKYTCPVCSPDYYEQIMKEIEDGGITEETRLKMAAAVFRKTSYYDSLIAQTLLPATDFENKIALPLHLESKLRYGENPHQTAAYYSIPGSKEEKVSDFFVAGKLHGKDLSYNNIQDVSAAVRILADLPQESCVVIKHTNPCGVASSKTLYESYLKAYEGDKVSIYGGIIGFKGDFDQKIANEMSKIFLDIIIARSYSPEAMEILKKRKNTIILQYKDWEKFIFNENKFFDVKRILDGFIIQSKDELNPIDEELKTVTSKKPMDKEIEDLRFAQIIVKHVKSNGIVIVKDKMVHGVGVGQMNRVTSALIALDKAGENSKGAVMASDAFFPMDDTVRLAASRGIIAIIQPGGSIKDQDSINACNELGIAMVFTGNRHFLH